MSPLWIALLALASAVAVGWLLRRRALARRAACRERLAAVLERKRPGLSLVESHPRWWRLRRDGRELATVDGRALTRAAVGSEDHRRRLLLAVADAAAAGPRPLAGDFDLKSHGGRALPRLADEGLELLVLQPPAVLYTAAGSGGLPTIYVIDGEPRPVYVADEHLIGAGIDARDLHGVAMAVLRQRFDESQPRRVLAGGDTLVIEPEDGCGGSRLLLLPEALRRGEALYASAPAPHLLVVAADRAALDGALAARSDPIHRLPPTVFRVTSGGLRMES